MPTGLERHDEAGHTHFWTISCYRRLGFFFDDGVKQVVVDGLRRLQSEFEICLIGYVVMPDHVHVLLYPHPRACEQPVPVSQLLNGFKQYVGYHGKQRLRDYWREHHRLWSRPLTDWAHGGFKRQSLWTTRAYDFNVDREAKLREKLDYCHKNPLTQGLVERPEEWRWSSYRYYETADRSLLAMDWDGQWPIVW
ncbi:MAG: transposase [Planctomycetes bacterium]|nr:transposase [Planctomycetota bacterium]